MKKNANLLYVLLLIPVLMIIILLTLEKPVSVIRNEDYQEKESIKVEVYGEVVKPGIYYLDDGATFSDLLNRCGKTDNTYLDSSQFNVKLKDGEIYEVCKSGENKYEIHLNVSSIRPDFDNQTSSLININKASLEELITLPGIGTVKANAIITYRESTPFQTKEDIKNVSGISDVLYEQIKDYITI